MVIREYTTQDISSIEAALYPFQRYLSDLDGLGQVQCYPGYGEVYTTDLLGKINEQGGQIFVAEEAGKIIGFTAGVIEKDTELDKYDSIPLKSGLITDVYVDEQYRGAGIGKQLMDAMEQYFRGQKCAVVFLEVFSPNTNAYNMYAHSGYVPRMHIMQKKL